ncbi:MAG: ArdC-like ssDNA-binding domain-containing protein [Candidatus Magasanikbacteria bacterium]|nr:ArdC-like ssDNA-binding domain-containing protein [Candidatus Magasanikbacteria bacterium]
MSSEQITSNWTGSEITMNMVRKQIFERWGEEEAKNYNPQSNCLTFKNWLDNGYKVKKGEKAIKSYVVIEKKDKQGEVTQKYPRTINLFYIKQVEPTSGSES